RPEPAAFQAQAASNRQGRGGAPLREFHADAVARWEAVRRLAAEQYEWLVGHDVARELARIDLPLSTYTQWYWKIDLHNLFHFLAVRADPHAQHEIRVFARVIAGMLKRVAPLSFEAWVDYEFRGTHLSRGELDALRRVVSVADGGLEAPSADRAFLEALVQLAAGLHLRTRRGATRGAVHLLAQAVIALEDYRPAAHGVDVEALIADVDACIAWLRTLDRPHRFLDRARLPSIR